MSCIFCNVCVYIYVLVAAKTTGNAGLFNNAAQVWNHTFYWESMKANGGGEPTGPVADLINSSFGSYANFRTEFENAGNTAFGSGWAWLVWTPTGLKVTKTSNADTPIAEEGAVPILTMVRIWMTSLQRLCASLHLFYNDVFLRIR